jgi:hypothetical protein
LLSFLKDPADSKAILFMPTGVIPDTIFNKSTDYLAPWVSAGGTMLWFGDTIGFYSGESNTPLNYSAPSNPGFNGVSQFVNLSVFGSLNQIYDNQSPASRAYGFSYAYGIPHNGLNVTEIQDQGGESLGGVAGNYTNAARIPLGRGTIDYFAVPLVHDVTQLSVGLANMLQSGALTGPFQPVGLTTFSVAAGTPQGGMITGTVPYLPWVNGSTDLCLLLYQTDLLAVYGNALCVPDGHLGGTLLPMGGRPSSLASPPAIGLSGMFKCWTDRGLLTSTGAQQVASRFAISRVIGPRSFQT